MYKAATNAMQNGMSRDFAEMLTIGSDIQATDDCRLLGARPKIPQSSGSTGLFPRPYGSTGVPISQSSGSTGGPIPFRPEIQSLDAMPWDVDVEILRNRKNDRIICVKEPLISRKKLVFTILRTRLFKPQLVFVFGVTNCHPENLPDRFYVNDKFSGGYSAVIPIKVADINVRAVEIEKLGKGALCSLTTVFQNGEKKSLAFKDTTEGKQIEAAGKCYPFIILEGFATEVKVQAFTIKKAGSGPNSQVQSGISNSFSMEPSAGPEFEVAAVQVPPIPQPHRGICLVCMDMEATYVLDPCGHICLCADCSSEYASDKCPTCRATIGKKFKVYFPGRDA